MIPLLDPEHQIYDGGHNNYMPHEDLAISTSGVCHPDDGAGPFSHAYSSVQCNAFDNYKDFVPSTWYPSPPSTSVEPGRSVPLPPEFCNQSSGAGVGGVLDSPILDAYTNAFEPLSPPPSPTCIAHLSLANEPATSAAVADGIPSASDLPPLDGIDDALLSPLSPEWTTSAIPDVGTDPSGRHFSVSSPYEYPEYSFVDSNIPIHDGGWGYCAGAPPFYRSPTDDIVDFPEPPDSPILHCVHALPALDHDSRLLESPAQTHVGLPSTDDEDRDQQLIPPLDLFDPPEYEPVNSSSADICPVLDRGLLFPDGSGDFARSPSPEEDICLSPSYCLEDSADPELHHICDLRRRYQTSELEAKQKEAVYTEQGLWALRDAAQRQRKQAKHCRKELSTLLRLKLGTLPEDEPSGLLFTSLEPPKKPIASMAQLVARMFIRRNDTSRPFCGRPCPLVFGTHLPPSPLVRHPAFPSSQTSTSRLGNTLP
ncbi:hypothetical protein FISHEDRAFT_73786 [Fistulina hepatica ATCC 64428]|uniref:Uncharacterized protein n=1 Tax=Fistulina hepatica ATCC 64428 TaxID=1128425 RepID=A0A0D7AB36_9AGAR|nr:hypothetical protein FISHEDRAFT_73786 [Fistulina hepatica ATCC 64428]